jgi:farnesyl diphosphate synthase
MPTMRDDLAFAVWSRERQQRIEAVLESLLAPAEGAAPSRLLSAMRHSTLGGGKRMRPLLAYAAAELTGGLPDAADACAAAVELIHAYSLIHDDLPCMDDDALRRGKPTCHVVYGVATALLAGDALQSLAFAALGRSRNATGEDCALLATAAGHAGMAGGQQLDLDATSTSVDIDALTRLHALKTGALIHAAVQLGARCGRPLDATEAQALDRYARTAGLAFQVVDDVLDVEGSAATLGKTAGKDAAQDKATFVTLLGLAEARARARALHDDAVAALVPFGAAAKRLAELVDWIALRTS